MPDVTVLVTELVGVVTTIVDVAVVVSVVKSHARYPPVSYRSIARLRAATVISHLLADVESFRRPSLSHWIVRKTPSHTLTVTILFRNTISVFVTYGSTERVTECRVIVLYMYLNLRLRGVGSSGSTCTPWQWMQQRAAPRIMINMFSIGRVVPCI